MKRFSLKSFLLFVAAISAWVACYVMSQQVADLKLKLRPLQVVSNSLIIDDPEKIAVARVDVGTVLRDFQWRTYLPAVKNDETFVLCLAQDSGCPSQLPSLDSDYVEKFPIPSGTHEISFVEQPEFENDKAKRQAQTKAQIHKMLEKDAKKEQMTGRGRFRTQGRNPVFELKVNGEVVSEFQRQLRNSADWELVFDSSSVQQSADQPFILSPTSWKPNYELYLWIQKIKK